MFGQSVKVGIVVNVITNRIRGFSSTTNLANAYYTSDLPERFYNEEQLQMQQSLKKVIDFY